MLTVERLREVLRYDAEDGLFTWLVSLSDNVKVGDPAGCLAASGYVLIAIDGTQYRAHRLAWLYVHGIWPEAQIDHINLTRWDNRIANLRPAKNAENSRNTGIRADNTSGFKGVSLFKRTGKWKAQAVINGKNKHIGYFATPEEAAVAYQEFVKPHHGEFSRTAMDLCREQTELT